MTEHDDDATTEADDRAARAFRETFSKHADDGGFQPLTVAEATASGRRGLPRWLPVAAAAVVVAAIAIPVVLNLRGPAPASAPGDHAPAPERATGAASTADDARPGWRWESRRTLSYQVPVSWGYGWSPASDWCASGGQQGTGPIVDIAPDNRAVRAIACPRAIPAGQLPTFVSVVATDDTADRGWDLPAGWSVTRGADIDGYRVEVVHSAGQASVAEQIVESARPIGRQEPNGCLATADVTDTGSDPVVRPSGVAPASASLCQYEVASGQLLAATRLPVIQAGRLARVLDEAPAGTGPDDASCELSGDTAAIVRLWYGGLAQDVVVRYAGCTGNGVFTGTTTRVLTGEVCTTVLQPPLTFSTGHGAAGRLCAPVATPSASPTPSRTR